MFQRDGMLLAHTRFATLADGEEPFEATVRFRTVGDATCTGCVESVAGTPAEVRRRGGRGPYHRTRCDPRPTTGLPRPRMEDRKREGYF